MKKSRKTTAKLPKNEYKIGTGTTEKELNQKRQKQLNAVIKKYKKK